MIIDRKKILHNITSIQIDGVNLNSSDILDEVFINNNTISLKLSISNPTLQFKNKLKHEISSAILREYPKAQLDIQFFVKSKKYKNIIAIASGKGGVGKSTISSNLAISLKNNGYKVGLIDADIYGPSIPLMFDAEHEKPKTVYHNGNACMSPIVSYGIKIMSIGFFSNPRVAVVWRGPMVTKALKELINNTHWGDLDYLLIDLPPGTGDIHLSLIQTLSITGALIVTTPQPVSIIDARKAINMFKKKEISIPIVGLVENMSSLLINNEAHYIFGKDGGKMLAKSESIQLLAELPLDQSIREAGDIGRPAALQQSALGDLFNDLARKVDYSIKSRNKDLPPTKKVKISHNRGCN